MLWRDDLVLCVFFKLYSQLNVFDSPQMLKMQPQLSYKQEYRKYSSLCLKLLSESLLENLFGWTVCATITLDNKELATE